jgi:spore coat protein U-like protein
MMINNNQKSKLARNSLGLAMAVALAGASFVAQAGTDTANLDVSAQVAPVCEILSTSQVAFGTLDPTVDNTATGGITWQCTNGTSAEITLGAGDNAGSSDAARLMTGLTNATETLAYQLYTDSGYTSPWLSSQNNGVTVAGTGYDGTGATETVYGLIAQGDAAAALNQAYDDVVVVTITF